MHTNGSRTVEKNGKVYEKSNKIRRKQIAKKVSSEEIRGVANGDVKWGKN